ncbi:actin-like protein arp8 [Imshaugia aleurites]|uniref:Actin-like protein arp8 n=1 Tax=Imshaugia aleurites TaxID=172621 RepID=A0A8H3J4X9_9LECA|nr:actin-like protein arp8 [Imshaugia aleurites]
MVGKRSGKALLREEGLERTDNNMDLTTWPQINPINQKNYYTDFLKRDDQILPLRLLQEERRNRMTAKARDRDRELAQANTNEATPSGVDLDMDDDAGMEDAGEPLTGQDALGSKVIVIHPGSQNLRIGLASDALPKTVPMVIARKWSMSESEDDGGEPSPKRRRTDDGSQMEPEEMFGEEFASQYNRMCADLKIHMRSNKRRVLPNSKELIVNYNKRTPPETISEHNDPFRVDWTEIPANPKEAPGFLTGKEALRIPDKSIPRYKLFWPLRYGWYNESEYREKKDLYDDIATIIEEAIKTQLNLRRKKDWVQYGCVFVVPDLYERHYVSQTLEMLMRDLGFGKVCFIQESLAATCGAGYTTACVVDVGAQKTSVCCVEEGMCIENSRINLKYGGADVTETFVRMMLYDHFPYADIDLKRRYDFLLAEELKSKFCTMNEGEISPQLFDFHLRVSGQDTRKYTFKTYDEVLLAPQGYYQPTIFDNSQKLKGRRNLIDRSYDLYEGGPNDPVSSAQSAVISLISPIVSVNGQTNGETSNGHTAPAPIKLAPNMIQKINDSERTPASTVGSPAPDDDDTPVPTSTATEALATSVRDDVLPVIALDTAILTSISHGARLDERKTRDFLSSVMVVGGGAQISGFYMSLEERLKDLRPGFAKDIVIGTPPRELDPQGVIWKGGSVFGKLRGTNDSWIGKMEYDRLGARLLVYKCMWAW